MVGYKVIFVFYITLFFLSSPVYALRSYSSSAAGGHANGANCAAGEIPLGVDANGAVEGCYEPTESDITDLAHQWTDAGTYLHPADLSGAEDIVIGGTTTGTADHWLKANGGAVFNQIQNDNDITFHGEDDNDMLYLATGFGRVGMGENSPDASLEIIDIGWPLLYVSSSAGGDGDYFTIDGTGDVGIADTTPDAQLEVVDDGTDIFMISNGESGNGDFFIMDTGGRIGIGDSTPIQTSQITTSYTETVTNTNIEGISMDVNQTRDSSASPTGKALYIDYDINSNLSGVFVGPVSYGIDMDLDTTGTSTIGIGGNSIFGMEIDITDSNTLNGGGVQQNIRGVKSDVASSGTYTNLDEHNVFAFDTDLTGNIGTTGNTNKYAYDADVSGTADNSYGFRTTVADATTNYGIRVGTQDSGVTTNYGMYIDIGNATNNYGLYIFGQGTAQTINDDIYIDAPEGVDANIVLDADNGDDATDTWEIESEAADNDLSFENNATEVFKITSSGAVQMDSNLTIGSGTSSLDYTITFDADSFDGIIQWMEDEDSFYFQDDVGVQIQTALSELHVGGTQPEIWVGDNGAESSGIIFDNSVDYWMGYNSAASYWGIGSSSTTIGSNPKIVIDTAGEVGINNSAPARNLHITDTMRLEPRATAPSVPASGDIYVDSTPAPDELCFYDGSSWQGISSGTDANCS